MPMSTALIVAHLNTKAVDPVQNFPLKELMTSFISNIENAIKFSTLVSQVFVFTNGKKSWGHLSNFGHNTVTIWVKLLHFGY